MTYTYNADGTVATKIDAKNQKVVYTYDSYKRVTQISRYPVSTGAENLCQRINFYYDSNPFAANYSQNVWGRLAAVLWDESGCGGRQFEEMYSYSAGDWS